MTEPWPEDKAFRTFARKVADGVLWAVNTGQRISRYRGPNQSCMCPLGATLIKDSPRDVGHPAPAHFLSKISRRIALWDSDTVLPDEQMVWAFIAGFEEGRESISQIDAVRASGRLGIVYRARFEGESAARWTSEIRRQRQNARAKRTRP